MPRANDDVEMKWGYAFAGALALGFAAVVQFVFGELTAEGAEALPAVLAVAYAAAGKLGLTVPLTILGVGLILFDVAKHVGGRKHPTTEVAPAPSSSIAATAPSAADRDAEAPAAPPSEGGKIRGGWRGSEAARRGKKVNSTEEGEEVRHEGPMTLAPIKEGKGNDGRVKLATERYMNWTKKPG